MKNQKSKLKTSIMFITKIIIQLIILIFLPFEAFGKYDNTFNDISNLKLWINKYPDDEVYGNTALRMKNFRKQLIKILGEKEWKNFLYIENHSTKFPIEKFQNFLRIMICKRHYCGDYELHFFVNVSTSEIFICKQESVNSDLQTNSIKHQVTWYGAKGRIRFDNQKCEIYDAKLKDTDWERTISLIPKEI